MRLEGVCCRSQGQPCSERKRSTMATSRRKDSPSGVDCPEGSCEDSGPVVAMVYLVCTVSPARASLSALRGIVRRCYTSRVHDASPRAFFCMSAEAFPRDGAPLTCHTVSLGRSRDHHATPRF